MKHTLLSSTMIYLHKIQGEQGRCVYLQKHEILREMVDHHKQSTNIQTDRMYRPYVPMENALKQVLHTFRELSMCTLQNIKFLWNYMYFISWPQDPYYILPHV